MFKKMLIISTLLITGANAHTAVMSCFDNGDDTITCEGGFSDGASGSGISMYLKQNDRKILEGQMNEDSEFTFNKPKDIYTVYFDAGKGHVVAIAGKDIVE